jgi:uncharacterized repeat protein (TIGR02543 family)
MKNAVLLVMLIAGIFLVACDFGDSGGGGDGLAAPTDLTVEASSPNSLSLRWTAVSGAAKYKIYKSVTSTGVYTYVDETEYNSYTVNDLVPSTTYYYKVSCVDTSDIEGPQSTYAQGTTQSPPSYTITFDVNNGSGAPPVAQTAGAAITLPSGSGLSRSGYNFGGWNTSAAGTGIPYSAGSSYTVLGSITLYAIWYDPNSIPSYTVTFNANSGSGTPPAPITQSFGTSFNLPGGSGLTRSGYIFGGWSTSQVSGMGTTYGASSSYTISGDITLYALWNESNTPIVDNVPGLTLNDKFAWLQGNAQSGNEYNIVLNSDQTINSQTLSYMDSGKNNITIRLRGSGAKRTISGNFLIGTGVTLVLENNIILHGKARVNSFGTLIMNEGSTITGNDIDLFWSGSTIGGGVHVGENGILIMNGGIISGNSVMGWQSTYSYGGGVAVNGGTFTMNSGTISGNTAKEDWSSSSYGGGVSVNSGTFTMNGGSIFGNTAINSSSYGGGVYVGDNGIFNMNGGTISSNTAKSTSSSYTDYYGGGVYVSGKFTKTGGTIYGYSATDSNSNVVSSGTVTYRGHAVYAHYSASIWKYKDTNAGPEVNLSFNGETGEFEGAWDF